MVSTKGIVPAVVISLLAARVCAAGVRFDVVGSPTEVINTGRSEVLGSIQLAVAGTGNSTGTSAGGATQIGMIFTGLQIDNTTTTGIKLVSSAGFTAAAPAVVGLENRDLNGVCSGFLTINLQPGATPVAGDFLRLEGVRGRIDASAGLTPGTDLFANLQSSNDPAGTSFSPDRIRMAKSLKGLNVAVVSDTLTYEIRITEGFARAFVDRDANNDGVNNNDRTDSFAGGLGSPTNSTQLVIRLDGIPTGISGISWPGVSTAAGTGAALYLLSNTFTAGASSSTASATYSFEAVNQVSASDIVIESFTIVPQFVFVAGRCDTDTLTTSITLGPAVAQASGCAAPADAARPRFFESIELQITSLSPAAVVAGSGAFSLTVNGTGFTPGSKILWNGAERPTSFAGATQLTATIPASDVAVAGSAVISVSNPSLGGAVSNTRTLVITVPALTLLYPRLVSKSGPQPDATEYTGIALANTSGRTATLKLTAFDRTGAVISGVGVTNPATLTMPAGRQRPLLDTELFGSGFQALNPIGWLKLEGDVAQVAGFFLSFNGSLTRLDGADVSSDTATSLVFPELAQPGFTQLHVANPSAGSAALTFELVSSDGTPRGSAVARNLDPNGALAEAVSELFPGVAAEASDYVRVTSSRGVAAFEYFGPAGRDVAGLNGQDAAGGAKTLYSPQYAVGGPDWRSTLSVVNFDAAAGTVTFRFISDDGVQIGVSRTLPIHERGKILVTDQKFFLDPGGTLQQGYVEITSSVRLAGSVVFGDAGSRGFTTSLPLASKLQGQLVFSQVASDATYFTGLALLNPGDTEASAVIQVFDFGGSVIVSRIETIPPKGRKSKLLTEFFPALERENISSGYITVTVNRNIAAFGLFGDRRLTVLSAVPPQVVP